MGPTGQIETYESECKPAVAQLSRHRTTDPNAGCGTDQVSVAKKQTED